MEIIYEVRSIYGESKAYPVNEAAKILASIAGTKTLTKATLRKAQALGFTTTQQHQNAFI